MHVCIYAMCMPGTSGGQKRVLGLLGLVIDGYEPTCGL